MSTERIEVEEKFRNLVAAHTWKFAKTMPQIPHEYVIRGKTMAYDDFEWMKAQIREHGVFEQFGRRMWQYLYIDNHKYWTDGWTPDHDILNRAKIE